MNLDRQALYGGGDLIRRQDRFLGEPVDLEGVAGEVSMMVTDQHADIWTSNRVAILVEQDLVMGGRRARYAAWFTVARGIWDRALEGAAKSDPRLETRLVALIFQDAVDTHLRPWLGSDDGRGWPTTFEPFRSLVALGGLLASVRRTARRLEDRWRPA